MRDAERGPGARLLAFLASRPDTTILGRPTMDALRVPTIAVAHARLSAKHVCNALARDSKIVARYGTFLAPRIVSALRLTLGDRWRDPDSGALRFSLVHYNNHDDVSRLIHALEAIGF
jgi:selenocysteine lyase/cysteine desulfurase